jgi:AGCS family alanine or glycine:cation symporter
MEEIIGVLNDIVWSDALIVLCLGQGFIFHKNTFLQIRHIKEMFRLLFDGKVQNLSFFSSIINVIGKVGTGNIAGVATAIAFEDRSSIWMWMVVFWSKYRFVEATLAQIYKEKHLGEFRGGPAFYIERIRREMVLFCRGFYHFGMYCCLEFKRTCCRWNTECL